MAFCPESSQMEPNNWVYPTKEREKEYKGSTKPLRKWPHKISKTVTHLIYQAASQTRRWYCSGIKMSSGREERDGRGELLTLLKSEKASPHDWRRSSEQWHAQNTCVQVWKRLAAILLLVITHYNAFWTDLQAAQGPSGHPPQSVKYSAWQISQEIFKHLNKMNLSFKEENEKVGLKLNTQKTKIKASWCHHFMAGRWGNSGNSGWLYFFGLQNHCKWWLQPWN